MRFFSYRFLSVVLVIGVWGGLGSAVDAQTFHIGAVLPLSGDAARTGQVAEAALRASVQTLLSAGIDADLTVLDSESRASYAKTQAKILITSGVHALLCCDTAAVAARVIPVATGAGVPVLSLAPAPIDKGVFSLSATEAQVLARLASRAPQLPLGVMAPSGTSGDLADYMLESVSVGTVRYPAARSPLTPEALLVATLEPGSVVIWDGATGTLKAAAALSARGYVGERIVRAEIWGALDALSRAELSGAVSVVSSAVLGYRLPDTHPAKEVVSSFRRALRGVLFESSDVDTLTTAAAAWDAAQLVGEAAEQLLTYADPTDFTAAAIRSGLRDALVGLGPHVGVGGSYDFSGSSPFGLLPDSLELAVWRGGRFYPYP